MNKEAGAGTVNKEAGAGTTLEARFTLPARRLECGVPEAHPPLDAVQARAEANRCLYCHDAPCIEACPTAIDIPEFIRRIGTDNVRGSARTILESNILGLSCASVCPTSVLCEGACVFNHTESPPIQIGRLQRYATEHVYERGDQLFEAGPSNGRRVACVGGGPASLACAHTLARLGYAVDVFERRARPGGLSATGVAPYKLKSETALREVRYILEVGGVTLHTDEEVDPERLGALSESHDAVFLGLGLGPDSRLGIPGEDAGGVIGAVDLIERIKNADRKDLAWLEAVERAIVIGGGNTSIDAARELRLVGVPKVTLVYRRGEERMRAYDHEVRGARQGGVRLLFQLQPVCVVADSDGKVAALKVQRTRAQGSGQLEGVAGSETLLPTNLVVLAIGQSRLGGLLAGIEGIELDRGLVVCDAETGQTGSPAFFAGGDCANGGKEVVNAAAEGHRAARGIHAWLEAKAKAESEDG